MEANLPDAQLAWLSHFFDATSADQWFGRLNGELAWAGHQIRIFGRMVAEPRLSAWYGESHCSYRYSGRTLAPLPLTAGLEQLRALLQAETGIHFNCALCNLYRNGSDSVAWHADDEPELGPDPPVASLSFGAPRRFQLRHRTLGQRIELILTPGSLLLMTGPTQRYWVHQVPKQAGEHEPRINVTFRRITAPHKSPMTLSPPRGGRS